MNNGPQEDDNVKLFTEEENNNVEEVLDVQSVSVDLQESPRHFQPIRDEDYDQCEADTDLVNESEAVQYPDDLPDPDEFYLVQNGHQDALIITEENRMVGEEDDEEEEMQAQYEDLLEKLESLPLMDEATFLKSLTAEQLGWYCYCCVHDIISILYLHYSTILRLTKTSLGCACY